MNKSYAPVGACIYCGAKQYIEEDPSSKLAREHIIAYALGGNLTLPEASCKKCEDITKKIEQNITRGIFLPARTKLKLPTRRKKERPTHLPLDIETMHGPETRAIPMADYPGMILTFDFPPAGILFGLQPTESFTGNVVLSMLPDFDKNLSKHHQRKVTWKMAAEAIMLGRMLAKIAHAYAAAEIGITQFKPYLLDIIMDRPPYYAAQFIGGEFGGALPPSADIYDISIESSTHTYNKNLIIVNIRLLANREGMPVYSVVAGERLTSAPATPAAPPINQGTASSAAPVLPL